MPEAEPGTAAADAPRPLGLYVKSYGCQMNALDGERMADLLRPLGYRPAAGPEDADVVVLNTCHIREKATEKVFSELGQLKRLKAEGGERMRIVVAGCVAQAEGEEILRRQPAVDFVVGPQAWRRLPEMLARPVPAAGDRLAAEFEVEAKFDGLPPRAPTGPIAHLAVQEGCDKFCTFCVVPYTRGPEHARPAAAILAEAAGLAARGVRELRLLGQNVNAWRGSAPDDGRRWGLGDLIRALAELPGIARLRYTTSHPRDMDEDLYAAHADVPQLAPYLHLPAQSGSDRILKAMNRGHTRDDYRRAVDRMRAARADMAIASDFIVGFPGETDADFAATLALVREVGFAAAFCFMYSRRPGTPAADMPGQVEDAVKRARLAELQAEVAAQALAFNRARVGRTLEVLLARPGRRPGQALGYSPWLQPVHLEDAAGRIGEFVAARIVSATAVSLAGELVAAPTGAAA